MANADKSGEQSISTVGEKQAKPVCTLHEATAKGDIEQIKSLLSKGADVNAKDDRGMTPLHIAAKGFREDGDGESKDYPALVQLLIAHGANVNVEDWDGKTSLALAKEKGRTEIVELHLKHGAKE